MFRLLLINCCLFILLSSCSVNSGEKTLFEQLNGKAGIERIVNSFIQQIAKDEHILPYFAKASVSHFRAGFINHMCDVSGGPCRYEGDSMIDIHTGMNISEADFNRVVELLIIAMEENHVSYSTQNKVLAKLAPMRKEVIKL